MKREKERNYHTPEVELIAMNQAALIAASAENEDMETDPEQEW